MIVVKDLHLVLNGHTILDRISFTVPRGESLALVGPNGSGKTSIFRCMLGLVPYRGSILVHGHDAWRDPVATRQEISYVPQKAAFGEASALEVLTFVAKVRRIDRSRVHDALCRVGLEHHGRDRVRTFSGGMQQRLSLAVALLADTPVLLLDEPSASLDRDGQQLFFEIIAGLRRRQCTLVLASHRPEEVQSLTDRVLHLDAGRLESAPAAPAEHGARVIALTVRGRRG